MVQHLDVKMVLVWESWWEPRMDLSLGSLQQTIETNHCMNAKSNSRLGRCDGRRLGNVEGLLVGGVLGAKLGSIVGGEVGTTLGTEVGGTELAALLELRLVQRWEAWLV